MNSRLRTSLDVAIILGLGVVYLCSLCVLTAFHGIRTGASRLHSLVKPTTIQPASHKEK